MKTLIDHINDPEIQKQIMNYNKSLEQQDQQKVIKSRLKTLIELYSHRLQAIHDAVKSKQLPESTNTRCAFYKLDLLCYLMQRRLSTMYAN